MVSLRAPASLPPGRSSSTLSCALWRQRRRRCRCLRVRQPEEGRRRAFRRHLVLSSGPSSQRSNCGGSGRGIRGRGKRCSRGRCKTSNASTMTRWARLRSAGPSCMRRGGGRRVLRRRCKATCMAACQRRRSLPVTLIQWYGRRHGNSVVTSSPFTSAGRGELEHWHQCSLPRRSLGCSAAPTTSSLRSRHPGPAGLQLPA